MKKFLFLFAAIIFCLAAFSQVPGATVTVTIDKVVPGELNGYPGDYITFTVDATNADAWGMSIGVVIDGQMNGGGGFDTPTVQGLFSHQINTATRFVGLQKKSLHRERTYTVRISYTPDGFTPDSGDPCYQISEPYSITGK